MQCRLRDHHLMIAVRKKPAEHKTEEFKTKGTSSLRDLPGSTPTICAMVPAKSRDCTSIGRRDTSHAHIMSRQPHTGTAKANHTAGEQVCLLPVSSPAAGLSSAPGAAAGGGSAVLARSAHSPPCEMLTALGQAQKHAA